MKELKGLNVAFATMDPTVSYYYVARNAQSVNPPYT